MNNPLSDDPEFDLYPYPAGCSGWRLWKMLPEGTTRSQYLEAFDRINLLRAREWNQGAARRAAEEIIPDLVGRFVVVLGTQVRTALVLPKAEPLSVNSTHVVAGGYGHDLTWLAFPHPSGRNHWFNCTDNYARACTTLVRLMRGELPYVA
jgi:hypothetical protein